MSTYSINEISNSVDRHKLYMLPCNLDNLDKAISYLQDQKINTINIGKEVAIFIEGLSDFNYLIYDVYDYAKKLLDSYKSKINGSGNDIVAIYNLGILFEPALELNAGQLLKEFSKTSALVIVWENLIEANDLLYWETQNNKYLLDFSDIQLKKMQYAV